MKEAHVSGDRCHRLIRSSALKQGICLVEPSVNAGAQLGQFTGVKVGH